MSENQQVGEEAGKTMQTGPCRLHIDHYKDFGFYSEWHGSHGQGRGGQAGEAWEGNEMT